MCVCVQVDLRAHDILKLIAIACEWYSAGKPYKGVPTPVGHISCSLRMVMVHETPTRGLEVLVMRGGESVEEGKGVVEGQSQLPVCLLSHEGRGIITSAIQKTLKVGEFMWWSFPVNHSRCMHA